MHLDRNQLAVNKFTHGVFQHLQFFRQIKIHASPPKRTFERSIASLRSRSSMTNNLNALNCLNGLNVSIFFLQTYTSRVPAGTPCARTVVGPACHRSQV